MPLRNPSARIVRSTSASASAVPASSSAAGYAWIQPTAKPSPGGRWRSESVSCDTSPSRTIAIAFISIPSTNSSTITSPRRESASVSANFDSRSSTRLEPEHAALAARVGGLDHVREADVCDGRARLLERARRAEPRLRDAGGLQPATHLDLVREAQRRRRRRSRRGRAPRRRRRPPPRRDLR